ncbi:hypothetical protein AB0J28_37210 [Streptosporangium canum]|uniref:hypothetical protein n=1 Tax=Streptosporangium canum TaxID=324952 RepID=UPI00342BF6D6
MPSTLEEILRSPVGRNSAHWLKWAEGWWANQDFWSLYEMCVVAALRFSEGADGLDDIPSGGDILAEARILAHTIDHHPLAHHLMRATSPQVHIGNLEEDVPAERNTGRETCYGKPKEVLWTSSLIANQSSWRAAIDSSFVPVAESKLNEYRLSFDISKAKIFNIDSVDDVTTLARSYGTPEGGQATIDWSAMRNDYDAVHLSFRGLVTTQGVAVSSANGAYAIKSWDCESTAWLNSDQFAGQVRRT